MKLFNVISCAFLILVLVSCVDDPEDINPPSLLDAPQLLLSIDTDTIIGGNNFNFSVNIIDAPGAISDSVVVSTPNDLGSFTTNIQSLVGQTEGVLTGTFTTPTNFEGDFGINITIFDQQENALNQTGAPKASLVSGSVYIKYPLSAPTFDVDIPNSEGLIRGESTTINVDRMDVPGGIANVIITADKGSVQLDQVDVDGLIGQTSGSISAEYVSDAAFVGDVNITVIVDDQQQDRRTERTETITTVYEFAAPTVDLFLESDEINAFSEVGLEIDISNAPGTVELIEVEAVEVTSTGDVGNLGTVALDSASVAVVTGSMGGVVTGTFTSDTKGFIDIRVTVTDAQGRVSTTSKEILVISCEISDIAGMYSALSSGESADAPVGPFTDLEATIDITGVPGLEFEISDLSFGLYGLQGFAPEPGTISLCDGEIVGFTSENGFISSVEGMVNNNGTISVSWASPFGDSGAVILTPQ